MAKEPKRRRMTRLLAIVLVALLALSAVVSAVISLAYAQEQAPPAATAALTLSVLEGVGGLRGSERIVYRNDTGKALQQILLTLYPNLFRREDTAPFEKEKLSDAYPAGFNPGGVELFLVRVNGADAAWGVKGAGEQFLRIDAALEPGESCEIELGFECLLPEAEGFYGLDKSALRFCLFAPLPLLYDKSLDGFEEISPTGRGDAAFSPEAEFSVTLDLPAEYALLAGLPIVQSEEANGRRACELSGRARSFDFALLREGTIYQGKTASGTAVSVAAGKDARAAVDLAVETLDSMEDMLGASLGTLSLGFSDTDAPVCAEGLILLPASYLQDRAELEKAIAFYTARQFFGFRTAANPERESWLTEAVSAYFALLCVEERRGYDAFLSALNDCCLNALNLTIPGDIGIDGERSYFQDGAAYENVVIRRGAAAMHELRVYLGREKFLDFLRRYFSENDGAVSTIAHFAAALNETAGRELDNFLMEALRGMGQYAGRGLEWYE